MRSKSLKLSALAWIGLAITGCQSIEEKSVHIQEQTVKAVSEKVEEGKRAATQAVDGKLDEAKAEASKAVSQKIDEAKQSVITEGAKLAQDAQRKIQGGLGAGAGFEEGKKQSLEMVERVKGGTSLDPKVKAWIGTMMANSDQAIRSVAIPTMQEVFNKFPEHRAWLETQVKAAAQASEGKAKEGWDDLLTNWQRIRAVAESKR